MDLAKLGTIVAIIAGILTIFQIVRGILKDRQRALIDCEEKDEKWLDIGIENKSTAINISQLSDTYKSITIHATNNDKRPITIIAAGFYLSNGKKTEKTGKEDHLPKRLEYEEKVSISFPIASLQKELMNHRTKASVIELLSNHIRKFLENHKVGKFRFRSPFYYHSLRLRSPIYTVRLEDEDPLQARLIEFLERDTDSNKASIVQLVHAFVRDSNNREYNFRVPKYLVNLFKETHLERYG